jgi:hypothetical protein
MKHLILWAFHFPIGIMGKKSAKKSTKICGVFTLGNAWSCEHYPQSALPWLHLVQAFITVMPAASVIPLHQKLFGGTVKAIIHHPTDFAGVQWDVLWNFFVLHFTGQKNLTHIYICPAVHMQVWTRDLCFIWLSPKRPKGGVWPSKSYTKSRILKAPIDHPYRLCWCSERCPMELFCSALYRTKESYIYIYIYVLLFTCKFEPVTCALFD